MKTSINIICNNIRIIIFIFLSIIGRNRINILNTSLIWIWGRQLKFLLCNLQRFRKLFCSFNSDLGLLITNIIKLIIRIFISRRRSSLIHITFAFRNLPPIWNYFLLARLYIIIFHI